MFTQGVDGRWLTGDEWTVFHREQTHKFYNRWTDMLTKNRVRPPTSEHGFQVGQNFSLFLIQRQIRL